MANTTKRGFRWHHSKNGGGKPATQWAFVADDYGTKLCIGDPVKPVSEGVERAAAGDTNICGVIVACWYWDGTFYKPSRYIPADTSYDTNLERKSKVGFIPVGGQVFEVDCDDGTTATTEANFNSLIHENADHVIESGSLNISYAALDISTHVTTTAQWRIENIAGYVNHDFAASRVKLLVSCNESTETGFSTTGA